MSPPTYAMAGEELIDLLGTACERAWLDGRTVVDTADLAAIVARRRLVPGPARARRQLWSRPYRCDLPAEAAGGTAIDHETSAALREAVWIGRLRARRAADEAAPRWCGCAHRVVRRALREAADVRVRDAHGAHLCLAMVKDPTGCGHRALAEAGLAPGSLEPALLAAVSRDGRVRAPALKQLSALGALEHPRPKPGRRLLGRMLLKRAGAAAVAYAVGAEAARQAIRSGADHVGAVHVLAAVSAVGFQQRRTTWVYECGLAEHDAAADVLARLGLDYPVLAMAVVRTPTDPVSGDRFGPWRLVRGDPGFAPAGRAVFRLAQSYVDYLGHPAVGSDHLLMGCIEVDSPAVRAAVAKAGADYEELRTQAARLLIASP